MPTRPCRFCLSLQKGRVFADFDINEEDHVHLLRISFDGYGCCKVVNGFKKMSSDESRLLIGAVDREQVKDPKIEILLRTYFDKNSDLIWRDALTDHHLI